jgi:hypothetical protein
MVLNPRDIPYCMTALRGLDVPTCWASYINEPAAAMAINEQVAATDYDRYVVISDDCEPTQGALDRVLALHDKHPEKAVTGWSNFDTTRHQDGSYTDKLPFVNLCWNRLRKPPPMPDSYRFMTRVEIEALPPGPISTTFAGLSFTCMTRELWLRFPLHCTSWGGQMDYQLSYDLQGAGVPIVAEPDGFVQHVKDTFGVYPDSSPEKQLLVGVREPAVTWTGVDE